MGTPHETSFKERLHARFREQSLPLLQSDGGVIPAASLWTGSRLWVGCLREEGIGAGSKLWLDHAPAPNVLQVLLAAWWLESDVVLGRMPAGDPGASLALFDCDLAIADLDHPSVVRPNGVAGPTARGEQPDWSGKPAVHDPWLLDWQRANQAFAVTGEHDPGTPVEIPRTWTTEEVLLGHVIPALADGSILLEDGWPAMEPQGASDVRTVSAT